ADVIFRHQLADLERQHPERLRVHHVISREAIDPGERVRGGRVHADLLREWIPDPDACMVFACGPAVSVHDRVLAKERNEKPAPRFMETALDALHEIGVPPARIRKESYG
ncbi:MAG: oxidoreductase, partial [Acidobacteria bacterium]|nr:oxidoreductase [Acidobacteriota bacterium]